MSLRKIGFFILSFVVVFSSCKKDDALDTVTIVIRDRGEQQIIDNDSIIGYLETHYYNSDFFIGNSDPSISDIVITEIADGESLPDGNTLLMEDVETKTTFYEDTDYEYYVLKLNQGGGAESPTFADNVSVIYEGFDLENEIFDSSISPVTFDLTSLIPGWRKVLTEFNTAESFTEPGDGTVVYLNHGAGVMFIPSGLAYFSNATTGSSYAPLIFKFDLIGTLENDHDGDGIPSYLEDLNGDGEFIVNFDDLTDATDDDTDGDGTPDYFDADDDGDGVLTRYEDTNEDGDPTNDIGANGIPKYLDPEEITSNNN